MTDDLEVPDWSPPPSEMAAAMDAEEQRLDAAARQAHDIATEAYKIRVRRDAQRQIAAEDATGVDFGPLYLDRAALRDLPKPQPLIERILPRHCYAILRGRDHAYKSFVAIDWGLCLATGKAWQGRALEQVRVLYIAGEGAYGIAARVAAWEYAWHTKVEPHGFTVRTAALNLHNPGPALDELLQRITTGGYGLVIVDTLRRVSGAADGNSSEMGTVVDNLDRIKRATLDGTVLTIAHTDKSDTDSRGYSGIEDDADVVWHAKRGETNLVLELTKMKDGPDGATIHLQAEAALGSLVLAAGSRTPANTTTEAQLKILDVMRQSFREGAHSGKILAATGLPDSTYYRAIGDLRDTGRIHNTGTKHRPFYELASDSTVTDGYSHDPESATTSDEPDSQQLPLDETGPDLHDSHDSHRLPHSLPLTPITPTTLRSGSSESESHNDVEGKAS